MEVLATIAGTATSTVSRWEKGELQPGLDELKRLREFAFAHGLAWSDRMLFEEV
jgi:DNA-binding transcriptional regulator YiaG